MFYNHFRTCKEEKNLKEEKKYLNSNKRIFGQDPRLQPDHVFLKSNEGKILTQQSLVTFFDKYWVTSGK